MNTGGVLCIMCGLNMGCCKLMIGLAVVEVSLNNGRSTMQQLPKLCGLNHVFLSNSSQW